jgi:hypothetical protein
LAVANEARMKALLAQEYVSKQEYDQASQVLKSARAQVAQVQAQNARDQANLGFTIIRSPVDGVVIDRVVDLGQTVAASFQTPTLIKIAQDLAEMRIDTSFAEADIGSIREGQKAQIYGRRLPEPQFRRRGAADPAESDDAAECGDLQRPHYRGQSGPYPAAGHDGLRQHRRPAAGRCPAGAERRLAFQTGRGCREKGGKCPQSAVDRRNDARCRCWV